MSERFPLTWPGTWRRTPPARRRRAKFKSAGQRISVADGFRRVLRQLRLLGATDLLVSSNIPRTAKGPPLSGGGEPEDTGVAAYFKLKGQPKSLACDTWTRVGDNMAAIAGHVEALRAIERYGVGTLDQIFAGYAALPSTAADWWLVLGIAHTATLEDVEAAYLRLAKEHHPDLGGSHDVMAKLSEAREYARRALAR